MIAARWRVRKVIFREEAQDAVVLNNFLDVLLLPESVKRQLELSMLLDARPHKCNLSPAAPLETTTDRGECRYEDVRKVLASELAALLHLLFKHHDGIIDVIS